jgi:hypothetical protein
MNLNLYEIRGTIRGLTEILKLHKLDQFYEATLESAEKLLSEDSIFYQYATNQTLLALRKEICSLREVNRGSEYVLSPWERHTNMTIKSQIPAIKRWRECTGDSLVDSKNAVDKIVAKIKAEEIDVFTVI